MSAYRLGQLAARHQAKVPEGAELESAGGGAAAGEIPPSYMEAVTAFIPSEIIGVYVAILGMFQPAADALKEKWGIFIAIGILLPLFIYLSHKVEVKKNPPAEETKSAVRRALLISMFLAIVAYVIWAAALPGSPFDAFGPLAQKMAGAAVFGFALLAPLIGELAGVVKINRS